MPASRGGAVHAAICGQLGRVGTDLLARLGPILPGSVPRRRPPSPAARLRGMAAGLLTAALAVAAHAMAGGAVPPGAAVVLLTVLAVTVGAVAATTDRTADTPALLALLAVGQLSAHVVLTAAGHTHCAAPAGPPAAAMLAAHTVALVIGAALIAASDRLCGAVSSAMRAFVRELPRTLATGAAAAVTAGDQPLRSVLLLAASVSHRGPPVSPAR